MTILWVAIGLGLVCIGFLIRKYMNTHKYDYVQLNLHCKNYGDVTNGLKCPHCKNEKLTKIVSN